MPLFETKSYRLSWKAQNEEFAIWQTGWLRCTTVNTVSLALKMSDTSREDAEPGKEAPRTVLKGLWCTTASQNTTQDNTECNSHYVNVMYIITVIATGNSHYLAAFWEEEVQTVLLPQITGWSPVLPVAKCSVSPNSRAPGEGTWAPKCPWGHTVSIIELKDRDIPHNLLSFQLLPTTHVYGCA